MADTSAQLQGVSSHDDARPTNDDDQSDDESSGCEDSRNVLPYPEDLAKGPPPPVEPQTAPTDQMTSKAPMLVASNEEQNQQEEVKVKNDLNPEGKD